MRPPLAQLAEHVVSDRLSAACREAGEKHSALKLIPPQSPSTGITMPVMYRAAGEAKNTARAHHAVKPGRFGDFDLDAVRENTEGTHLDVIQITR